MTYCNCHRVARLQGIRHRASNRRQHLLTRYALHTHAARDAWYYQLPILHVDREQVHLQCYDMVVHSPRKDYKYICLSQTGFHAYVGQLASMNDIYLEVCSAEGACPPLIPDQERLL